MDRRIPLLFVGLLVFVMAIGLAVSNVHAQTLSTAVADGAVAIAQTSPNIVVSSGVAAAIPVVVTTPQAIVVRPAYVYAPRRVIYVAPVPYVRVAPAKVTCYRRLYATPLRNAAFGRYRTTVELVSYPLLR